MQIQQGTILKSSLSPEKVGVISARTIGDSQMKWDYSVIGLHGSIHLDARVEAEQRFNTTPI